MTILLLDNYDSFTWNLVQRIGELDASLDVLVVRNDKITVAEARTLLNSSRKYVLPLLEYLDQQRITRRTGDERVLR